MPTSSIEERLRGLVLSASELKRLTDWPDAIVEDYLNLLSNVVTIVEFIDTELSDSIENTPTDFTDGSVPYANDGFLVENNEALLFNEQEKSLLVGGSIKGPNRVKQYFFAGF